MEPVGVWDGNPTCSKFYLVALPNRKTRPSEQARGLRFSWKRSNAPQDMMPSAYLPDYDEDMELLRANAVAAGILAAGYFRRDIDNWTKDNASPVSEADMVVDDYLRQSLIAARPDYGWLSEESVDDDSRLNAPRSFIIDPIDGTSAFLRGDDCWTISLAIVENGVSVAGVIYAPARNQLYQACLGGGAKLNGQPLLCDAEAKSSPIIPAPGAVKTALKDLGVKFTPGQHYPSLAYRLVQVASGVVDAAVARRGAQDWDIAAAALILSEAGAIFDDVCVGAPVFNKTELRHGALAAVANPSIKPQLHEALITVYGCPEGDAPPSDKGQIHE